MTALLIPAKAPVLLPDDHHDDGPAGAASGSGHLDVIAALLDGSPGAAEALAPARALAARLDADLVVIRADAPIGGVDDALRSAAARLAGMGRSREGGLEEAVAAARAHGLRARGLRVAAPVHVAAESAPALWAAAQESGAGLLVLSTSAATSATSQARETLAARSPLPLLWVPPRYGARADDGAMQWLGWEQAALQAKRTGQATSPLRLLVALDGAPAAERALPLVCELAQSLAAQLSLVRVVPSGATLYGAGANAVAAVDAGLAYLQRTATRLQCVGMRPDGIRTAVRIGDPAHELLAQAAREQATMLVLARRTVGTVGGAIPPLHDSVTAHLLQRAPLPVLVIPAA